MPKGALGIGHRENLTFVGKTSKCTALHLIRTLLRTAQSCNWHTARAIDRGAPLSLHGAPGVRCTLFRFSGSGVSQRSAAPPGARA